MEFVYFLLLAALCQRSESVPAIIQLKSNAITSVSNEPPDVRRSLVREGWRRRRSLFDEATKRTLLDKHNELRRTEPAADMEELTWSDVLASMADDWAVQCRWEHGQPSRPPGSVPYEHVGQNLYSSNGTVDLAGAVQVWYDEASYYDWETGACSKPPCGHYTQLVWSTSRELGCAYARCPTMTKSDIINAYYLVCNYGPAGNYVGKKPYALGRPCTACQSGHFWCHEGLCRRGCTRQDTKCTCQAECQNCGSVSTDSCTCKCADGWHGTTCSERCLDTHVYCGRIPGWPLDWCNVTYVRDYCPRMCGLCVEWTAAREQHCSNSLTTKTPGVMTKTKDKTVKTAQPVIVTTVTTIHDSDAGVKTASQLNNTIQQRNESISHNKNNTQIVLINGAVCYSYRYSFYLVLIQLAIIQIMHFITSS